LQQEAEQGVLLDAVYLFRHGSWSPLKP
jgi:hypothetical protein